MPEQRRTPISRRAVLGVVAIVAAGASGCSADSTLDSLRPSPLPTPPAPKNPDRAVIDQVTALVRDADAGAPASFARLHATQLRALGAKARPGRAGQWRQRQRALADQLSNAALDAHDPDLVRLLASTSASQRQALSSEGLA